MMNDGMMMGTHCGMMWMLLCAFFGVILLAGIVLLIVWVTKMLVKGGSKRDAETALDILKKRYARGEITSEEFERMRRDISQPGER